MPAWRGFLARRFWRAGLNPVSRNQSKLGLSTAGSCLDSLQWRFMRCFPCLFQSLEAITRNWLKCILFCYDMSEWLYRLNDFSVLRCTAKINQALRSRSEFACQASSIIELACWGPNDGAFTNGYTQKDLQQWGFRFVWPHVRPCCKLATCPEVSMRFETNINLCSCVRIVVSFTAFEITLWVAYVGNR